MRASKLQWRGTCVTNGRPVGRHWRRACRVIEPRRVIHHVSQPPIQGLDAADCRGTHKSEGKAARSR